MQRYIDVHCHMFNIGHVPLLTFLRRYGAGLQFASHELPLFHFDNRVREFVQLSGCRGEEILHGAILGARKATGAGEIVLTPLMMDMAHEDPGKNHDDQLADAHFALQRVNGRAGHFGIRIMPFAGLDPRCFDLDTRRGREVLGKRLSLIRSTRNHGDIIGLKIYPPLGVQPAHPALAHPVDGVYAYCLSRDIPIAVHCAPGGFYSAQLTRTQARTYSNPLIWKDVLKRFPGLRLNLAHFGGVEEWRQWRRHASDSNWAETIMGIVSDPAHPNVYADISYLGQDRKTLRTIRRLAELNPALRRKILFGTDYYLICKEMDYAEYVRRAMDEKDGLGRELFEQCADVNAGEFLKL